MSCKHLSNIFALLCTLASACDSTAPALAATDAGTDGSVLQPSDVPAVRFAGDTAMCPAGFATAPTTGRHVRYESGGQMREFNLILPPESFTGPRPVFLGFNGTGESGPSFSSRAELADFAARGFVVIAPSSNMNGTVWPVWDDMRQPTDTARPNLDIAFVDNLLACIAGHYALDANRIYAGGHSAGGIFTNAYVQRRSSILAGAIVASGVIDLTAPPAPQSPLSPMFVIVTWGGDNDTYSGGPNITVPMFRFAEQASLETKFYEQQAATTQVNCRPMPGMGHVWLPINNWFIDRLLEHPKGLPGLETDVVPASGNPRISCTGDVYEFASGLEITCPPATMDPGCQSACQRIADCGAANATVSPVIAEQLTMLGIRGSDCGACVTKCETDATTAADTQVLACMDTTLNSNMCSGAGIAGFSPWASALNTCCMNRTDSTWCVEVCRILKTNGAAASFFPTCTAL